MTERKRQQIKAKVNKGQARAKARESSLQERAIEARDGAVGFVRENPLLTLVGALALGVTVSMLFRRPREAGGKVAKQTAKKASGLAALAVQVALPFIQQAIAGAAEAGRAGIDRAEDLGESASRQARALGRAGQERAGETLDAAEGIATRASRRVAKVIRSRSH